MRCIICEEKTSGSLEFCRKCYNSKEYDVKTSGNEWVRYLKNSAQRERRRREKEYNQVSIDAILAYEFADRDNLRRGR